VTYRIRAFPRDGIWLARAEREDGAVLLGVDGSGATEEEAIGRLKRWLGWQQEHESALAALQAAERVYNRTLVNTFAQGSATRSPESDRALHAVDAARRALDILRSSQPQRTT
jgi:hypothetical protein